MPTVVEEAMSGALIRKCSRCGVPYVKMVIADGSGILFKYVFTEKFEFTN